jgi:signal transduction histidine kinase
VFFNLLANACQHTSDGDSIEVQGAPSYVDADMVRVRCRHSGTSSPRVDPFFSTRKESGGSGLGLAITKKIIERHRGSIQVTSRMGEGTVFQIVIPLQKAG